LDGWDAACVRYAVVEVDVDVEVGVPIYWDGYAAGRSSAGVEATLMRVVIMGWRVVCKKGDDKSVTVSGKVTICSMLLLYVVSHVRSEMGMGMFNFGAPDIV